MKKEPESIWRQPWKGARGLLLWFALLGCTAFVVVFLLGLAFSGLHNVRDVLGFTVFDLIISICLALVGTSIFWFIRWLCHWRNFKRFLFGLACFITLIGLFYAEENWRGKHDWQSFKHEWEAKGERFDLAGVIPPSVPDDQNFALTPVFDAVDKLMDPKWRAQHRNPHQGQEGDQMEWDTNLVNRLEMVISKNGDDPTNGTGNWQKATMSNLAAWQQYYHGLVAATNEFPVPPQPQTPAQDVLLALSPYDSTIEELRVAARLPYSRFPVAYDMEPAAAILLPHLSGLKHASQVLQLRALAELQNGQSDQALADIKLMLRLSDSIKSEPFLICHLVHVAIVNLAIQPIWEGLVAHQWSDAQLKELAAELAKLDLLADNHTAMRGELMLCEIGDIEYLRRYPEQTPDYVEEGGPSSRQQRIIWRAIPDGWFYQNELRCAHAILEYYLPLAHVTQRMVRPGDVQSANSAIASELKYPNPYNILARLFVPAMGNAVRRSAYGQESVDLARVAIALERYRLAHGTYPGSLDALVPEFLAQLPHDIINGGPLHYRRTTDGQFVLYSVGWNETDDGGVVVLNKASSTRIDISQGDWVWRSSAVKN